RGSMNTKLGATMAVGQLEHFLKVHRAVWNDPLAWLLRFATERQVAYKTRRLQIRSRRDVRQLQLEALAFAKGPITKHGAWDAAANAPLPEWDDLTAAHNRLWIEVLGPFRNGEDAEIDVPWHGALILRTTGVVEEVSLTHEMATRD